MSSKPDVVDIELERIARERKARETKGDREDRRNTPPQLLPPPSDPMGVARKFVEHSLLQNGVAGELRLRCWHGS
jgi:hypothetical protein